MARLPRIFWLLVFAAALLMPPRSAAQSGTVTDDAFVSGNSVTQLLNANGQGISLIVAGSTVEVGPVHVGTTTTFIKFQLQSSLPPATAAANVAKATLKLFLSPGVSPTGAINLYPVIGAWSESTLSPSSPPALAATPFAASIAVGKAGSFLVIDVTQLVQQWLEGSANGGLDNDGIAIEAATPATYVVFDSKESFVTSHEPRLEIVLTDSGPQGPQGPQGSEGPQGPQGSQGSQGPAGATGPAGANGAPGAAATVQVGTVATGSPGSSGSVTNVGTPSAAILNFSVPQGAVGVNNRGVWSASNSYNVNDAVSDGGGYWLALVATSANSATPSTSCEPSQPGCSSSWQQLAAQGAPGPTGAPGGQGPAGLAGPSGAPGAAATVQVGTVTTGAPGSQAAVSNGGNSNAAVLNFTIPQGAAGSGTGGFNGVQEFTQSGSFTVPAGITHIFVEMWGGGGGGGAGGFAISEPGSFGQYVDRTSGSPIAYCSGTSGFGCGAGGYTRGVAAVTPGAVYTITVGATGAPGTPPGNVDTGMGAGGNGGDSEITDSSGTVLIKAGGGQGGSAGEAGLVTEDESGNFGCVIGSNSAGLAGAGGQGGTGTGVIGRNGSGGSSPVSSPENGLQTTTAPPIGSIPVGFDATGGAGGAAGVPLCTVINPNTIPKTYSCVLPLGRNGFSGSAGGQGYILMMW